MCHPSQVVRLATDMQLYPDRHVLEAPFLLHDYKPELIAKFLENIVPENMMCVAVADSPFFLFLVGCLDLFSLPLLPCRDASIDSTLPFNQMLNISPSFCSLAIISRSYKGKTMQKEPWYQTEYERVALSETQLRAWRNAGTDSSLHLPERNIFIASNFELCDRANVRSRCLFLLF